MTSPLTYVMEDETIVRFTSIQLSALEEMATIYCCHTTGMHSPGHWIDGKYICSIQRSEAFKKLCKTLGINPKSISKPGCGWCQRYDDQGREIKGRGLKLFGDDPTLGGEMK